MLYTNILTYHKYYNSTRYVILTFSFSFEIRATNPFVRGLFLKNYGSVKKNKQKNIDFCYIALWK